MDLHSHTVACYHAYSTVHEYVMQAEEIGMQMIAITDHGPDLPDAPHCWHFHNLKVIPRLVRAVAVLRGAEANIRADGSLDLTDDELKRLDIVLAGFHPNYASVSREENTRLLKKVICSGVVDVIAHPGNPQYPIDFEEVLVCAKEHNVAIEINSSSSINSRRGSHAYCAEGARLANKIGNTISLGSDSHICYFLGRFEESYKVIEESGLNYQNIINISPIKVLDFLESRGHAPIAELRAHFTPYS